jgi:hypothetical protein
MSDDRGSDEITRPSSQLNTHGETEGTQGGPEEFVDVPLARERVDVERITIGRAIDPIPSIREDGDTMILLAVEKVLVVPRTVILGKSFISGVHDRSAAASCVAQTGGADHAHHGRDTGS